MSYTLYQMAWIVLIYSCLGWCAEVAFAAVRRGRFVNRGFLNGPVCPIYGMGVLIVVLLLEPAKDNLALLFFGSVLLTSALEFVIGYVMELFFHDKWWDYSKNPYNIKGYVCLEMSLVWGVACVLVVDVVHPLIMRLVNAIPPVFGRWLAIGLFVLMGTDAVLTLMELLKLPKRFRAMNELEKSIKAVSDAMGEKLIFEPVEKSRERQEAFDEKYPELAEKKREYAQSFIDRRSEINEQAKEREDARRAALAEKRTELEKKLGAVKGKNIVHRRIMSAYPTLLDGRHNGMNFQKLKEHYQAIKDKKAG